MTSPNSPDPQAASSQKPRVNLGALRKLIKRQPTTIQNPGQLSKAPYSDPDLVEFIKFADQHNREVRARLWRSLKEGGDEQVS